MAATVQNHRTAGTPYTVVKIVILVCMKRLVVTAQLLPRRFSKTRKRNRINGFLGRARLPQSIFSVADSERM